MSGMTDPHSEPSPSATPAAVRPTRRGRRILIAGLAVAALVGAAFGVHWWTHPAVFGGWGNGIETTQGPGADYKAVNVSFTTPLERNETVTLRSATPVVSRNTAGAVIVVHVCTRSASGNFIAANGRLEDLCDRIRPVSGTSMNTAEQFLVVTASPTQPGTVRIAGLHLSYVRAWSHLAQRGTERVGIEMVLHAR